MLVVVGLMVWAGVRNLRARRAVMQQQQVMLVKQNAIGTANATGSGSDDMPAEMIPLKGKMAPGFSLVDVSGKKVSLADYKGKPVVINFWATYCAPCKLEMPWFEEFTAKYKDQGLVVLGVDQDEDMGKDAVGASAKKSGVTYPILMPDKAIAKDYQLGDYLPQTFYVNRDGLVVDEVIGGRSKDEIEADVRKTF